MMTDPTRVIVWGLIIAAIVTFLVTPPSENVENENCRYVVCHVEECL